jgi:aspartate/methionine/tyrosine aminotransferase
MDAARAAVGDDEFNSYLPFTGRDDVKQAIAQFSQRRSGVAVDPATITITGGEGDCMLNGLLVGTDPGDGVIVTDPTYAGMINRVRLAGCRPQVVALAVRAWRLDLDALHAAVDDATRAIFFGNPSFPTGFRLDAGEWEAICALCHERDLWLLYWSAYEGIVYDGAAPVSPLSFEGMPERTIVMGAGSMEWRLIGYRVGWTFGPERVAGDLAKVHIYNAICPGGIGQAALRAALAVDDLAGCVAEWQRRRDVVLEQLDGLPIVRADGAWSMVLDAEALGFDSAELSGRLLEQKIAATPMKGWGGPVAGRQVRFVFSNEPVERLATVGERVRAALR